MSDSFDDARRLRQEIGELWSRLRIAEARLAEAEALLREASSASGVQYKPCEICTTQSWCETHGCQCYPVNAVQPERCCLDYPRCDCNSPPESEGAE